MKFPPILALSVALALGYFYPFGNPLGASSGNLVVLADADLDGLDDALEARLLTDPNNSDTDGDLVPDIEEVLLGTNPNVAGAAGSFPPPEPKLHIDAYSLGPDLVLQISGHVQQSIISPSFVWADANNLASLPAWDMRAYRIDHGSRPSVKSGWNVASARFLIPKSIVSSEPSASLAVRAFIDGEDVAAAVMFTQVDGYLAQFRTGFGSSSMTWSGSASPAHPANPSLQPGGSTSTGGGGGLFPVDPTEGGAPSSSSADEVCLQVLELTANLGGGRMAYRVADAYCDSLPQALCFSGCVGTIDDVIIGIDIISLLGG